MVNTGSSATVVFRSKIGYVLLGFVVLLLAGVQYVLGKVSTIGVAFWLVGGLNALILCYLLYLNLCTRYSFVDGRYLEIRCGFLFNKRIEISEIVQVRATRSWLASPAPALDRLELKMSSGGRVMISPKDQAGFVKQLAVLNPKVQLR